MQQCINIFIIPYLYEAQHVSGDKPSIIRNLKLCSFKLIMMGGVSPVIHESVLIKVFFFIWPNSPPVGQGLLIHEVSRSHSTTNQNRQDSSERVISPTQRPLTDNTRHSQQTDIHAPSGIRTHNLSMRAAADLRFRPRGL